MNDIRITSIVCSIFPSYSSLRASKSLVTLHVLKSGLHPSVIKFLTPLNSEMATNAITTKGIMFAQAGRLGGSILKAMFCYNGGPDRWCSGLDAGIVGFPGLCCLDKLRDTRLGQHCDNSCSTNGTGVVGSDASVDDCVDMVYWTAG